MEKENGFLKFELNDNLISSLNQFGYNEPTDVQKKVIPLILKGKDVLVKSMTGTGKTAAYAIPIIQTTEVDENSVQCLVIVPTRELAAQTASEIQRIGRNSRIKSEAFYGGQEIDAQEKILKGRVHIVSGTPGRILDLLSRNLLDVSKLKYFVVDEADRLFEMGFIEEVMKISDYIPKPRQTMMFTATVTQELFSIIDYLMQNPFQVDATPESITVNKIEQYYCFTEERNKERALCSLLNEKNVESAIIFCNTKKVTEDLAANLKRMKYPAKCLNSDISQDDRNKILSQFRKGEFIFLIATDVAARGLDINDVTHVFNYDIPVNPVNYVHRIGRTGRAGKSGTAITFVSPYEEKALNNLEVYLSLKLEEKQIPEEAFKNRNIAYSNMAQIKAQRKSSTDKIVNNADKKVSMERIFISGGRKNKISAGDIVGAITSIENINKEDIGIIDIYDTYTFVDILNDKGSLVIEELNGGSIKKKKVKVGYAKDDK